MKLASFKSEIKKLDQDFLQSILDGSALMMDKDEALNLGTSNGAFVIFWIEDEDFSSVEKLRDYLMIEGKRYGSDNSRPYILPQDRAVNIDTEIDFIVAELLLSKRIPNK